MINSKNITTVAKSWIGTKFHHQGRIKINKYNKGGCDCVGLIIGVCDEVGYKYKNKPLSFYDNINYGRIHKNNQLKEHFDIYFYKVGKIKQGSILVIQINKDLQHCCIVSEFITKREYKIIHCDVKSRGVVENFLSNEFAERVVGVYSI